jgi:signal transduction histidine kinase
MTDDLLRMRRADQEKWRFVALLAHQIISPLATAYTCISTLAKLSGRLSCEESSALVRGALDKVVAVQELTKKLLDLNAIQDGQALADIVDVRIVDVIRGQVNSRQEAARAKNIRLIDSLPDVTCSVRADPTGLATIFAHLLENAITYSPSGTDIVVSGGVENDVFCGSVRDRGPGIRHEDIAHLFDEFFRCADAATKGTAGSGLGLSFVRALATRYGGTIQVDSQLGQGSTFTVSFPCV